MAKRTTPRGQAQDTATARKTKATRGRTAEGTADAPPETASDIAASQPRDKDVQSMSMGSEPSEEDIRMRAYHRYLERGGGHGMDFEDWLEAEREIKLKQNS
jgi:Protein of unknown function (DUF2934)